MTKEFTNSPAAKATKLASETRQAEPNAISYAS